MIGRAIVGLVRHRAFTFAGVLALTALSVGLAAARVRPDFSVDHVVPVRDPARRAYERYKADFPYGDARAVVIVEAADIYTPAGLERLRALARDLGALEGVVDAEGLTTVRHIEATGEDELSTGRLFPDRDLAPAEIDRRRAIATTDPLYAWRVASPDGRATAIRVTLAAEGDPRADTRARFLARMRFLRDARAVLARHERPGQTLTLSGFPVTRAEYAEMIGRDVLRLVPVAFLFVVALLLVAFREARAVAGAMITVVAAVLWTFGALAVVPYWDGVALRLGAPLTLLTQVAPVIVTIVSISDTVHIVSGLRERLGRGEAHDDALAEAVADSAGPCLLTEIVIACGFLSLVAIDIVAIVQFGVTLAAGVMLAWLANMTVLPLCLHAFGPRPANAHASKPAGAGAAAGPGAFGRFVAFVEHVVVARRGRVVAGTLAILALAAVAATRTHRDYRVYDDLRPDSPIARRLARCTDAYGGTVPLSVVIRPAGESASRDAKADADADAEPMLEPEAIALADRIARHMRTTFPEARNAASPGDFFRRVHGAIAGEEAAVAQPLPSTRGLAAKEALLFDDGKMLRDVLSFDRRAACVFATVPDQGAERTRAFTDRLEARLAVERAAVQGRYEIEATGVLAMADDVHRTLVGGLAASFGIAILVSLAAFCAVLRSVRLGLIGLVPNLLPLALTFAFMGLAGIPLKPSTAIAFSVTLTIADDDTIQFLARFRRQFAAAVARGAADAHEEAVLATLRETGLPMVVTACAVSIGFLTLALSQFVGLVHLGLLIGVSLFAAVFADLFVTPVLILFFRPRIS